MSKIMPREVFKIQLILMSPHIYAHIKGGSSCWEDFGLADWDLFAYPEGQTKIYTATKHFWESEVWCMTRPGARWYAIFAKEDSHAPWVQVSEDMLISDSGPPSWKLSFSLIPGGACGLTLTADQLRDDPTFGTDPNRINFNVSGAFDRNKCQGLAASIAQVPFESMALKSMDTTIPDATLHISMKVGDSEVIHLGGLDTASVWELEQCQGSAISSQGVKARHTNKKALPSVVQIKAIQTGMEICDITGWHYPERSKVTTFRYVFNVK